MMMVTEVLKHAVPYYQPIIELERGVVVGYEVLARMATGDGVTSLGPWFHDAPVPASAPGHLARH